MAKNKKKMQRKLVKGMTILWAAVFLLLSDFPVSAAEYQKEREMPPNTYRSPEKELDTPSVTADPDYLAPSDEVQEAYFNPMRGMGGRGLPSLRNQYPYGTCWAFSLIGTAEINHYVKTKEEIDLSELHLAYFTYQMAVDSPGNLEGDDNIFFGSGGNILNNGGDQWMAANVLTTWQGVAAEETAPYENAAESLPPPEGNGLDPAIADEDVLHLQGLYRFSLKDDRELAKRMIKEKGSVATAYSHSDYDYNWQHHAFYSNVARKVNHAIVLVGWDDNFPKENFSDWPEYQPEGNGAWLVRNSWTSVDNQDTFDMYGYFWISYYDMTLEDTAYALDFESADNYDNNYQYDGAGREWYDWSESKEVKLANVFTVGAGENQWEELKAVSFMTGNVNVDYTVDIYTDLEDSANPESGVLAAEASVSGRTEAAGYYTVPLTAGVKMRPGTDFAVVLTLSKESEEIQVVREATLSDFYKTVAHTERGRGFIADNGSNWCDSMDWKFLGGIHGDLKIKAFTDLCEETVEAPTGITLSPDTLHLNVGEIGQLTATLQPAEAVSRISWTSSEETIASVDGKGNVTALQPGTAVITATAGRVSAQCSVTVKRKEPSEPGEPTEPEEPTSIELNYKEAELMLGESLKLSATLQPAGIEHQIEWSSSDSAIASVDTEGSVRTHESGKAVITAGAGDKTAVCTVNVSFPFSDVPIVKGNWKYESVCYVYANGIMQGIAGTDWFKPDEPLTRAMFATVLYRMAGSEPIEYDDKFPDVAPDKWYSDAVIWANKEGIVSGLGDGNYGINVNITREQIAKMLYKYAEGKGFDVSTRASLDTYTDSEQVSGWAEEYMKWAAGVGMISGKPNGDGSYRLDPKGEATRAECAAMLKRFQGKYN